MTREEQIKQAAIERGCIEGTAEYFGFIQGARYADQNPTSPWISIEERLPEKVNKFLSDEVLVRYLRGGKEYTFVTHYDYEYQTWNIPNVTHWMPIPQIEKGENN